MKKIFASNDTDILLKISGGSSAEFQALLESFKKHVEQLTSEEIENEQSGSLKDIDETEDT